MTVYQRTINVRTKGYYDFVKITDRVSKIVEGSKIKNGVTFVNSKHNTAALIMQENDATIHKDLINMLDKILPLRGKYEHDYEGNENAAAHLKQNILGNSVSVPVTNGKLAFGGWQDIFLVELFESRNREIVVTVIGE